MVPFVLLLRYQCFATRSHDSLAGTLSPTQCISLRRPTMTTCFTQMAPASRSRRPRLCVHAPLLQVGAAKRTFALG